jgi:hypothetical protein
MHPDHGARPYVGYLQWAAGYFAMFFILVHGWDGTGYQRFFSPDEGSLANWSWPTAWAWLNSPVAHTLEVEAIFIVPPILGLSARWLRQGYASQEVPAADAARMGAGTLASSILVFSILVLPAVAVVASVLVRTLGWAFGTFGFSCFAWLVLLRRGGVLHRHFEQLYFARPLFGRGAAALVTHPA